ncbi:hypothetical protein RFI_24210 [Reticulomyxa filosa]|uniref:Uncharacterized protein n=1 Tax=Reticulomyxa filosa TaxID=46433 RepID=X6MJC0_RETFI|nr:hypothetical protein RFI_24210 [Reticulomyxa filosa]|eukprot:ETO13165.1 hypothetical protein RFI_24210 [Reticulomyxa filosa]
MSSQTPLESSTNLLLNRTLAEISDLNVHFSYQFIKIGYVMFGHEFDDYYEIENLVRITSNLGSYRRDKSYPIHKSDDLYKYFLKALDYIPDEHIVDSFMVVVNVELQSYYSVDQKHLEVLSKVFNIFKKYNILIATDKCEFFQNELIFLGQVISSKGVSANPEYINKVLIITKPKTKKQLERLL